MKEQIDIADTKVLVDIVKLVQKKGMEGKLGNWHNFLLSHDKKFGSSLRDPARRSRETLVAFLKTFTKQDDLKIFDAIIRRHSNQDLFKLYKGKSDGIPEQRLVQNTLQHPLYPLDYAFGEVDEDWVVINLSKKNRVLKFTKMIAIDCEMVLCEDGTEAVVSVCVVDRNLKVKLNKRVHPNKAIADYRTEITGVSPKDLEGVTCSLFKIQKFLRKMLVDGTILVGHSLHNDLRALKLDYVRVIDTSYIFQYSDDNTHKRPSLNTLCKAVLGYEVREAGAPHNCRDDATAAMKLVLAKIERGVDYAIPLPQPLVVESDMAKLLLHKISCRVTTEELRKVVPGDFNLQLGPRKGAIYSAYAIFKNPQEANKAFESLQGHQEQDSDRRPQKLVEFQLNTGKKASIYVRKMAPDGPSDSKRDLEAAEIEGKASKKAKMDPEIEGTASKKAKMDPEIEGNTTTISNKCETHLNEIEALNQRLKESDLEIESLKQQLKQKEYEISILNKMVYSLNKKLGK